MKNTKKYNTDIVIIGGGISGIYAAKRCLEKGLSVLLLERSGHLGGRIQTVYHPTYHIEAGAGRFNKNHRILRSLLQEYKLHEAPIPLKRNVATSLLRKVIQEGKKYENDDLINMTFKTLCEKVLGKEQTKALITLFGYNAEFEVANAAASLEMMQRDFMQSQFYVCQEGFGELVRRMEHSIAPRCTIYKSTEATNIESKSSYCVVHAIDANGATRRYIGKHVICAIPKTDLAKLKQFNSEHIDLFEAVAPISLNRVYGEFPHCPQAWFQNVPRTMTDNKIRQFIPVDPKQGVAMISYSDTKYADYWKRQSDRGTDHLKKEVLKQLHAVFPDVPKIPSPDWIQSYYWPAGVHMWKPGYSPDTIIPHMQNIMNRVHIVGEAYCKIQGWIEGALDSVEDVLKKEII
jgi:monoamine oxidase